jgi:hypothetical protein
MRLTLAIKNEKAPKNQIISLIFRRFFRGASDISLIS